jgi:hypothetical protein
MQGDADGAVAEAQAQLDDARLVDEKSQMSALSTSAAPLGCRLRRV